MAPIITWQNIGCCNMNSMNAINLVKVFQSITLIYQHAQVCAPSSLSNNTEGIVITVSLFSIEYE